MSGFISFGGGSPQNIDTTYERVGFTATGTGTSIQAGAVANTKAATFTTLSAATSGSFAGFWVFLQISSTSAARFLIDIAVGAAPSETVIVPDIFSTPGVVGVGEQILFCPINVAAGTRISARSQSSTGSATIQVAIIGEIRTANHPPLYNNCERVTTNPTNTFPSGTDIAGVATADTGWVTLKDPTARTYGALLSMIGTQTSATAADNAQSVSFRLATGAAASEVWFFSTLSNGPATTSPSMPRFPLIPIYKTIPSGTRLAGEILLTTTSAQNTYSPLVLGFY